MPLPLQQHQQQKQKRRRRRRRVRRTADHGLLPTVGRRESNSLRLAGFDDRAKGRRRDAGNDAAAAAAAAGRSELGRRS